MSDREILAAERIDSNENNSQQCLTDVGQVHDQGRRGGEGGRPILAPNR